MRKGDLEMFAWPFVLLVGRNITEVNDSLKMRFWRDHTILLGLVVMPTTILESLNLGLHIWVYLSLVAFGALLYIKFIVEWRVYLKTES
jgi:hypothetical protein